MPSPQPDTNEMLILRTAINLFAENGYNETKFVEIVRTTGITRNLFHHYFVNKQEILSSILEQLWQKLADEMDELADNKELDPLEKIDKMIDSTIDTFAGNKNLALVFFNEHNPLIRGKNDSLNAHYVHYLKAFARIFEAGIRGEFINRNADGRVLLFYILGGLRNVINEWAYTPKLFELSAIRESVKYQVKHGILRW